VKVSEYWDDPNHVNSGAWYEKVIPGFRHLSDSELPPGTFSGNTFTALATNPDVYLVWLKQKLHEEYDVEFVRAEVSTMEQAKEMLRCNIMVNASGLGAETLASDPLVVGVRGQTMLVESPIDETSPSKRMDKEVRIRRGTEYTYVLPRLLSGGVIIGGISDEGNTSTGVSTELRNDILRRVNIMTGGMFKDVKVKRDIVGIRPDRKGGYRLERSGDVIHAYGFGGCGFRYSVGAAHVVRSLVQEALLPSSKL
jgi:glycine/D-amino acid oxidase-like deaminating enzyme